MSAHTPQKEGGRVSLPTMIHFLKQPEQILGLEIRFGDMTIHDRKTFLPRGRFNLLNRTGKIYVDPFALVFIRARVEENTEFSATDKVVKDALTAVLNDWINEQHEACVRTAGAPSWLMGDAE